MSQRAGSGRISMAASVVGQNLEAVVLEAPGQCLDMRMILPRRQTVHKHNDGHGRVT